MAQLVYEWAEEISVPDSERNRYPDVDVLNGIAYDPEGDRLFVTGKHWPRLYEIKLVPHE